MPSSEFELIPVNEIWLDRDERQRKEFTTEDLEDSIRERGLINPILVQREDKKLIAGERRWTACKNLGWMDIPVHYTDEIDPQILTLIELEENVKRKDLTWQEETEAVAKFHDMQREINGEDWSLEKTAESLNSSYTHVQRRVAVAKELRRGNLTVASVDRFSKAEGLVRRAEERAKQSKLDVVDKVTASPTPISIEEIEEQAEPIIQREAPLINIDFKDWLKTNKQKFNFIHCDFPYGIDADRIQQGGAVNEHGSYADSEDVYFDLLKTFSDNLDKFVADSAHLMFWFSPKFYQETFRSLNKLWTVDPFPLIWFRSDNKGMLPDPERGPRRVYEMAFMASRGDRKIVRAKANVAAAATTKEIHPSEKPRDMLRHFLPMFIDENSFMLDPTCGSANAVRVAEELGAKLAVGLERDEEFYNKAKENYYD